MAVSEFIDNVQSPYRLSSVLLVYVDKRERRVDQFRI